MSTPVPAEFLGLGRRFREQIADADDVAVGVIAQIFTPLGKRADRSPRPRPEMLQDAARLWRQKMPSIGLIDRKMQLSRKELHIREVRLGGGSWQHDPKDERGNEPGVGVLLVELHVAIGICQLMVDSAAMVPLHALGRWYQRSLNNSEAALIADLGRLAADYGSILDRAAAVGDPSFFCPTPNGRWAGAIAQRFSNATGRPERVLNVRTFLPRAA
jgi:hypothetical protein